MRVESGTDVFFAIGDPTRRKLLEVLMIGEHSIASLCDHFNISRNAIVKHLQVLKDAELISMSRLGREKRCKLQAQALFGVNHWIKMFEPFWKEKLNELEHFLDTYIEEDS
jgi:DNA-binding transcriptional ArsR family regulator